MSGKHRPADLEQQSRLNATVLHLHSLIEELAAHGDFPWRDTPEMKAFDALRNKITHGVGAQPIPAELASAVESMTEFFRKIERSSLGTSASHRIRRLSSARNVAAILARAEPAATELLDAARAEMARGRYDKAIGYARKAELAEPYRAKLLIAQALDGQGLYEQANQEFWHGNGTRLPSWMDDEERLRTTIAMAVQLRLRGRSNEAVALLEPVVNELRTASQGLLRNDVATAAKLELARDLQRAGKARAARNLAGDVVDGYPKEGHSQHSQRLEALAVQAEATLVLEFDLDLQGWILEFNPDSQGWERASTGMRAFKSEYEELLGEGHPLTLSLWVKADYVLLALGKPRQAIRALADTDQAIVRWLGDEHPLRLRVRYALAQAYGQLAEYSHQVELLEELLPDQIRILGGQHIETLATQLDLGIALVMGDLGPRERAIKLVDEVTATIRSALGRTTDLSVRATVARQVVRLPQFLVDAFLLHHRTFVAKKKQ
ncbi:hypothetical protein [Amycolatopsis japonica]